MFANSVQRLPTEPAYSLVIIFCVDREMFRQTLVTVIAALIFVPSYVEAGVIEYQEVALRYTIGTSVRNFDNGGSDSEFRGTQIESNPQDTVSRSALTGGSAEVALTFDLDEETNTFSLDASVAAIGNLAEDIGANVEATIRLFIDFIIVSDSSDPVELLFTADSSFLGLEEFVQSGAIVDVSSRLGAGSTRVFADDPFSRTVRFPVLAGLGFGERTQSIFIEPNQPFSIVSTLDLGNRFSGLEFADGVGNLRLTTSLAVQSVPEPPLMGVLSLGCLVFMRRRSLHKAKMA